MKNFRFLLTGLVLMTFGICSNLFAQGQSWAANAKFGLLFPGTVTISPPGVDVDTEIGWILHVKADALVSPKFSIGGLVSFAGTSAEESSESVSIMNFGGTLKGWFPMQNGWQIRPGVLLAYQLTTGDAFDDVSGFDIGAFAELAIPLKTRFNAVVAELGFISQPAGGNTDADVTWAPVFYLQLGYEFGG